MRKILLDNLPKKDGFGANKNKKVIDWGKSTNLTLNFIYDDISGEIKIIQYTSKGQKLKIEYKNKIYNIGTNEIINCKLGRVLGVLTSEFKADIGDCFKDENRDITIIDREVRKYNRKRYFDNIKYYKYKCNKCGNQDWKDENGLLKSKTGCSSCCKVGRNSLIEGVTDIPTIAPWMIKYFQGGYDEAKLYTVGTNKKIYPICPDCGLIKSKPIRIADIYRRKSIGCSCGDGKSYGSKVVFSVLEQLGLRFQQEVKFDWCVFPKYKNEEIKRSGYYDFVLEDFNIVVEVDGEFHRIDNRMNGQTKEESMYIDNIKDKLAENHGYKVVRINCSTTDHDEIKGNIIKSFLSELFDLSKVDWLKCEDFAMTNLLKKVSEHWNAKEEWETTKTIASLFHISDMCVRNYLKRATKIGISNYNPKLESIKAGIKSSAKNSKRVEILKDGKSMGTYNSVLELANVSEEKFNCKLNKSCIASVARGEKKHHRGYTFRYI